MYHCLAAPDLASPSLTFFFFNLDNCDKYCLHLLRVFHVPGTLQSALFMLVSFNPYNCPVMISNIMPTL